MPSSPTDVTLGALATAYDEALEALLRDDVRRVAALLEVAEQHLTELGTADAEAFGEDSTALHHRARNGHGCLVDALSRARETTLEELRRVRDGRRAMRSYGRVAHR